MGAEQFDWRIKERIGKLVGLEGCDISKGQKSKMGARHSTRVFDLGAEN